MSQTRSRSVGRRRFTLASVAVTSVLLAVGCGAAQVDPQNDLCVQYSQLVEQVDHVSEIDPKSADVDEIRTRVEHAQEELDAFQATAEGRLDTMITTLRAALNDFVVTASAAGQEALAAARPALEDARDAVDEAWARLQQVADVRCGEA